MIGGAIKAVFDGLAKLIDSAARLGELPLAAALWLFILILVAFIIFKLRQEKLVSEKAWDIRIKEVETDALFMQGVEQGFSRLAEKVEKGLERVEHEIERIGSAIPKDKEKKDV